MNLNEIFIKNFLRILEEKGMHLSDYMKLQSVDLADFFDGYNVKPVSLDSVARASARLQVPVKDFFEGFDPAHEIQFIEDGYKQKYTSGLEEKNELLQQLLAAQRASKDKKTNNKK